MRDIEMHAKAILIRAQQQADELLSAAQKEAAVLKDQGFAEGLAEGKAAGTQQGLSEGNVTGHAQALQEHKSALSDAVGAISQALQ